MTGTYDGVLYLVVLLVRPIVAVPSFHGYFCSPRKVQYLMLNEELKKSGSPGKFQRPYSQMRKSGVALVTSSQIIFQDHWNKPTRSHRTSKLIQVHLEEDL